MKASIACFREGRKINYFFLPTV